MKTVIVYKSKTGFTKKYAEMIAGEVSCDLMELKKATPEKLAQYDVVVFGTRFFAGMVDELKKAKELVARSGAKKFAVFATGATPNAAEDIVNDMWKNNFTPEELETIPHFYMQSGICYDKMPFGEKMMMKMAAKMMKNQKDKDEMGQGFEEALKGSFDISDIAYIAPLVDYLKED
nr:flavodoxin domain-containing protein [Lachnospiraceae bacterium]